MGKVYKFTTSREYSFELPSLKDVMEFKAAWISIKNSIITIPKGYSWDGCSPKFKIFGKVFGTWDGKGDPPETYWASMVHDAIYQYKEFYPMSRKHADLIFLKMLQANNFKYAKVYYKAVRLFGWIYGKWKFYI